MTKLREEELKAQLGALKDAVRGQLQHHESNQASAASSARQRREQGGDVAAKLQLRMAAVEPVAVVSGNYQASATSDRVEEQLRDTEARLCAAEAALEATSTWVEQRLDAVEDERLRMAEFSREALLCLRQENKALRDERTEAEACINSFEICSDASVAEIKALSDALEASRSQLEAVECRQHGNEDGIWQLQAELAAEKRLSAEAQEHANRFAGLVDALRSERHGQDAAHSATKVSLEQLEMEHRNAVASSEARQVELQVNLHESEQALEEARRMTQTARARETELRADLEQCTEAARAREQALQRDIESATHRHQDLQRKLEALHARESEFQATLGQLQAERDADRLRIAELQASCQRLESERHHHAQTSTFREKELTWHAETMERELAGAKASAENHAQVAQELQETRKHAAKLEVHLERLQEELHVRDSKIEALKQDALRFRQQHAKIMASFTDDVRQRHEGSLMLGDKVREVSEHLSSLGSDMADVQNRLVQVSKAANAAVARSVSPMRNLSPMPEAKSAWVTRPQSLTPDRFGFNVAACTDSGAPVLALGASSPVPRSAAPLWSTPDGRGLHGIDSPAAAGPLVPRRGLMRAVGSPAPRGPASHAVSVPRACAGRESAEELDMENREGMPTIAAALPPESQQHGVTFSTNNGEDWDKQELAQSEEVNPNVYKPAVYHDPWTSEGGSDELEGAATSDPVEEDAPRSPEVSAPPRSPETSASGRPPVPRQSSRRSLQPLDMSVQDESAQSPPMAAGNGRAPFARSKSPSLGLVDRTLSEALNLLGVNEPGSETNTSSPSSKPRKRAADIQESLAATLRAASALKNSELEESAGRGPRLEGPQVKMFGSSEQLAESTASSMVHSPAYHVPGLLQWGAESPQASTTGSPTGRFGSPTAASAAQLSSRVSRWPKRMLASNLEDAQDGQLDGYAPMSPERGMDDFR